MQIKGIFHKLCNRWCWELSPDVQWLGRCVSLFPDLNAMAKRKLLAFLQTNLQLSTLRSVTSLTGLSLIVLVEYQGFNFKMKGYFKKNYYILKYGFINQLQCHINLGLFTMKTSTLNLFISVTIPVTALYYRHLHHMILLSSLSENVILFSFV